MKTYKQLISEVKQTVKNWQAGVRSSQLGGVPDSEQMKNPDFQAGWKAGLQKGNDALDPSNRAKRVARQKAKMVQSGSIEEENLSEGNKPTNPELWSRAKALAKQKFKVYPSAYANGWAAKWYKGKGGGWESESDNSSED